MRADFIKENKPELPVDYNGNAIQVWTIGGRTIHVSSEDFTAESSLIRVCSGESVVKIKLKDRYPEDKDSGMPIPPNTVLCFGCWPGDVFSVEGEADITFIRDRGYTKEEETTITPSILSWGSDKIGGEFCKCEVEENVAKFSGMIDYYYFDSIRNKIAGNKVGIEIKPSVDISKYPNFVASIEEYGQIKMFNNSIFYLDEKGQTIFKKDFLVKEVPSEFSIVFDWTGKGTSKESFKVEILSGTVLRNG